ncbi:MAG: YebC/PmpR family DNA-binding transcriptional regulator [Verrucomicrobia bacterium]|jgi:YebC/PmpR family DNA-binding regulatory protein|nr:YebC/PmpR family DNA-binding transcriptional regulator [Verrucomicrobiota bacterium]NBD39355.1 YebC/PmpR family DNA-binding transcriptional regulator [Verrucomicrobiota bacterium]
MSGHSKWATTKRHKAAVDAKRGKIFSAISKDLTLAARAGGSDPEFNPRLRTYIAKAKASNMPADNIDRAIKKGTGELPGVEYHELQYEGYGPGGIGIIVEVTTDNKNRAASEVRSTFSKYGGNLAQPGALQHFFNKQGQFLIEAGKTEEDSLMELALENGGEDVLNNGDHFEVRCDITEFDNLSSAFDKAGIEPDSAELAQIPTNLTPLSDEDTVRKLMRLLNALEELDDVQNVYDNSDIDDALLAKVG